MATTSQLPESIQSLLDRGVLRRIDETEFVIDDLQHRERTYPLCHLSFVIGPLCLQTKSA